MYSDIRSNISKLQQAGVNITALAIRENRDLTSDELKLHGEIMDEIEHLQKELPVGTPLALQGILGGQTTQRASYELRGPQDSKRYKDLYGSTGKTWQDKDINFFQAVFSGRHHPELIQNAALTESVPSGSGFLVPTEYAEKIHNVSLENEIVMPRCFVQPMKSNEIRLPAMEIGSHGSSLFGGFTASYTAETGTISENNPKVRRMTLKAKKLTGMLRFSNELVSDTPGGEDQLLNICGKGLSWYRDKAFLKGTGAGEPLGLLNSGCLVVVEKESEQIADTINYKNLTNMMSRMYAGSFSNSIWICHQTVIPQLLQLSISVGDAGSHYPVLSETNGVWKILTRPVIFTEKTEVLGDQGDIILADLSQYVVGLRSDMRLDFSPHVHFSTDELLARLIERHDGQPLWDEPLTLADGSTTVSPFVVLQAR